MQATINNEAPAKLVHQAARQLIFSRAQRERDLRKPLEMPLNVCSTLIYVGGAFIHYYNLKVNCN